MPPSRLYAVLPSLGDALGVWLVPEDALEMKRKIRKVLMKTMMAAAAHAWEAWVALVMEARASQTEEERQEAVIRRAVSRLKNRELAAAFGLSLVKDLKQDV